MQNLRGSVEIDQERTRVHNELQEQIKAEGLVSDMVSDIQQKIIELKGQISQLEVEKHPYVMTKNKARQNRRLTEERLKSLTSEYWAATKEGR